MTTINYKDCRNYFLVTASDKKRYKNLINQVNGKWDSKHSGWKVNYQQKELLTNLIKLSFPEDIIQGIQKETIPDNKVVSEEAIKSENILETNVSSIDDTNKEIESSDDEIFNLINLKSRKKQKKYKRAISEDEYTSDENIVLKPDEKELSVNIADDEDCSISSIDSRSSSSSEDFPNTSPRRKEMVNDKIVDKIQQMQLKYAESKIKKKINTGNKNE